MPLRPEQLSAHLKQALAPREGGAVRALLTLHGDDPLLVQEAADTVRAAARAAGCEERSVFHVSGAHFDWSGVLGAAQSMSLFSSGRLVEIRIPSGKPGKEGAEALQRYAACLPDEVVTLVTLPRLDATALRSAWFAALEAAGVSVKIDPVERERASQQIDHQRNQKLPGHAKKNRRDRVDGMQEQPLGIALQLHEAAHDAPPAPMVRYQIQNHQRADAGQPAERQEREYIFRGIVADARQQKRLVTTTSKLR